MKILLLVFSAFLAVASPAFAQTKSHNGNVCRTTYTIVKKEMVSEDTTAKEAPKKLATKLKAAAFKLSNGKFSGKADHVYIAVRQNAYGIIFVDDKDCFVGFVGPMNARQLELFTDGEDPNSSPVINQDS